jgi:hypothetical protein
MAGVLWRMTNGEQQLRMAFRSEIRHSVQGNAWQPVRHGKILIFHARN